MESHREDQLIADLRALRPTPRREFTADLDERAAAGFPRRTRLPRLSFGRLPAIQRRRLTAAAGAAAVLALAVATALVATHERTEPQGNSLLSLSNPAGGEASESFAPSSRGAATEGESAAAESSGAEVSRASAAGNAVAAGERLSDFNASFHLRHRDVERSAAIVLGADPADVADDSAKVFEAVHAHRGIVLRSGTRQGPAGRAGARFELLIPSAELGDALADLSAIDEVRSRHEATADITAPTVDAAELLQDSRARIDSLLAQLGDAETEPEREAVEAELRHERRHGARLAAQLDRLHRRADFSRVSLAIETGERSETDGAWGVDDAVHDAGDILAVAAAVSLIALAVLGPIALIALATWLAHRAWVRRERRRVLS